MLYISTCSVVQQLASTSKTFYHIFFPIVNNNKKKVKVKIIREGKKKKSQIIQLGSWAHVCVLSNQFLYERVILTVYPPATEYLPRRMGPHRL